MAWRLAPAGLRVVYWSSARSLMARPLDFDALLRPHRGEGPGARRHRRAAPRHRHRRPACSSTAPRRSGTSRAHDRAGAAPSRRPSSRPAASTDDPRPARAPRRLPDGASAPARQGRRRRRPTRRPAMPAAAAVTVRPLDGLGPGARPRRHARGASRATRCSASAIPVWSRTPELADMAQRDDRADLGGRPGPDRGRGGRQRLAPRGPARRRGSTATTRTAACRSAGTPGSACRRRRWWSC